MIEFIVFCLLFTAPSDSLVKVSEIQGEFNSVHCNSMGNIYAVNSKNNLIKMNLKGDALFSFEDKSFPVYFADVSNALKVLVYNSKQNRVGFLDKTLSLIGTPIELDEFDIPMVNAVASSRDNAFWVFDDNAQELKKINLQNKEVNNSGNLISILGRRIDPVLMQEENSKVYLLDTLLGVFQFDHLGTYLFHFKKVKAKKIIVKGDKIVFLKGKELYLYDTVLLEENKIPLPQGLLIKDFAISRHNLFLLIEQSIQVYRTAF